MNIDDMTIGQIKEIKKFFDSQVSADADNIWIGKKVFIRRAGQYHYLGFVTNVTEKDIIMIRASWVADSMYFADFCKNGLDVDGIEIEPFVCDVLVSVPRENSEISEWSHELPTEPIR